MLALAEMQVVIVPKKFMTLGREESRTDETNLKVIMV